MNRTTTQRQNRQHHQVPPLRQMFAHDGGAQAAHRLFALCAQHAGGSTRAIAHFLVGLYNAAYAPSDPAWLCRWSDDATFEDVLATMHWVRANRQHEIHHILAGDGGDAMLDLMQRFALGPFAPHDD